MAIPQGAKILVVSATHGEGTTWVATNFAASMGRQGEKVLLVDCQIRLRNDLPSLRDLVMQADEPNNPTDLAQAYQNLSHHSDLQNVISFAGKQKALGEYSWDTITNKLINIYEEAIHENPVR